MLPFPIVLALSAFINFVDRGNLSAASPPLKTELCLFDPQLGILLAAFFWSYAFFQIGSGWLVDRIDIKWMLAAGFFVHDWRPRRSWKAIGLLARGRRWFVFQMKRRSADSETLGRTRL